MSDLTELKQKLATLQAAHEHAVATANVLMKELASGGVPCVELRKYNELAAAIFSAQFKLWTKLSLQGVITGNLPAFPPMPVLFWEHSPGRGFAFACRAGLDIVQKTQFKAVRLDKPTDLLWSFFGTASNTQMVQQVVTPGRDETLGLAPIVLIIAGIAVAVSGTVVAKVAIDAAKDKALSQDTLDGMKAEAELRRFLAEARLEFVQACQGKGEGAQACAGAAVQAAESLPKDFNKLGKDKFGGAGKAAWLFGGGLAALAAVGGAMLYSRRDRRRF
jgi:hypothetical protein